MRGALWDPVDLFEIVIARQRYPGTQRERPRPLNSEHTVPILAGLNKYIYPIA